jgi:hypothetical protein
MVTEVRELQLRKALSLIAFTDEGIATDISLLHPTKAKLPKEDT